MVRMAPSARVRFGGREQVAEGRGIGERLGVRRRAAAELDGNHCRRDLGRRDLGDPGATMEVNEQRRGALGQFFGEEQRTERQ
jgi:hypothetical protein